MYFEREKEYVTIDAQGRRDLVIGGASDQRGVTRVLIASKDHDRAKQDLSLGRRDSIRGLDAQEHRYIGELHLCFPFFRSRFAAPLLNAAHSERTVPSFSLAACRWPPLELPGRAPRPFRLVVTNPTMVLRLERGPDRPRPPAPLGHASCCRPPGSFRTDRGSRA